MVDVVAEFKHFSEYFIFRIVNFTHVSLAEQIAVCCVAFACIFSSLVLFISLYGHTLQRLLLD